MKEKDNVFFEEYKRLDRLCAEMFGGQIGVSAYIQEMEQKEHDGRYRVSSWSAEYKMLKHVRWVRNQIAHDSSTGEYSEQQDLAFIKGFYQRILNGQDPLTLLRKTMEAQRKPVQIYRPQAPVFVQPPTRQKKKGAVAGLTLIVFGLALLLLLLYLRFSGYV